MNIEFKDFEEQVSKIRVSAAIEIENMFVKHNVNEIDTDDEELAIISESGVLSVLTIGCRNIANSLNVYLTTDNSEIHDLLDLETDDIVAIYNFIYYFFEENKIKFAS